MSDEELSGFAACVQLRRYAPGFVFFRSPEANLAAPLRIIVQGHLQWTAIADPDTAGGPTLGAGALFGLASINEWARKHEHHRELAIPNPPGFIAEANEDLWVLELAIRDYHRAFGRPVCSRLVRRLIGLHGGRAWTNKFVHALRATPEFARACPMHVGRVVESGVLERWSSRWSVIADGSPEKMALRYVVSGQVRMTESETGLSVVYRAGDLLPHERIFAPDEPPRSFEALGDAQVVRIRRASLDVTIRTTPGCARTLGSGFVDGEWGGEAEGSYPVTALGELTLVLADAGVGELPLGGLIELLAATMRESLGDRVALVRLLPAGGESRVSPFGVPETLLVPDDARLSETVRAHLVELVHSWGMLFDHILVDPSALALDDRRRAELMVALVGLPCPTQVSYLVRSPEDWASLPERIGPIGGLAVLPTALLGPLPHARGQARRLAHVAGQLFDMPWSYPKPWPIDAVRLRLREPLLAELRRRARLGVAQREPLSLDSDEMSAARASLGRWARAVTWRRVGIGIGGAGSQSYVAIPFIRRLQALGIPIDVISGSSTGAFIGAFYSLFGEAGLEQMIAKRHHFGFAVAASWFHNAPFELLLTYLLEGLDLNDLELPVIAVAARAADGETAYLSSPLAGRACMASGSLPPMVPTYIRNRRLLDGGLTLDVPTAILTSAGAELIVGVQPIPRVNPRSLVGTDVFVPPNLRFVAMVNPLQRSLDLYRSYLMLFRQAARGYEPNADVVYEATTRETHAALFAYGAAVVRDAEHSDALALAVERTQSEWRRMLARAPGRVTFVPASGTFELGSTSRLALGVARHPCDERLSVHAEIMVQQGAAFLERHPEFGLRVVLHAPQDEPEPSIERWRAVLDGALTKAGCRTAPAYSIGRVAGLRSIEFELCVRPRDAQPAPQATSSGDAAQSESDASSSS